MGLASAGYCRVYSASCAQQGHFDPRGRATNRDSVDFPRGVTFDTNWSGNAWQEFENLLPAPFPFVLNGHDSLVEPDDRVFVIGPDI